MNEEEVVVSTQPEEQVEQQPEKRSQTLGETLDNVQQGMSDVGSAVETFGKGEEQLANMIDGGEKAAQTVGTAASSAAEKSTDAAIKAAEAREKALRDEMAIRASGLKDGIIEGKLEVAKKMLSKKMKIEDIAELTEFSLDEIRKIASEKDNI